MIQSFASFLSEVIEVLLFLALLCVSGNFEVTVVSTGALIHSKTTKGQGRCEDAAEKEAVFEAVRAHLATLSA